ncbi:MAG: SUMF1/EgtB/PvdO family nonheme iron enzyme [Pirellulaceae bacterium]
MLISRIVCVIVAFVAVIQPAVVNGQSLPGEIRDSTGQVLRLIEPIHFEMGSQETAEFRKDHVNRPVEDSGPQHAVILTRPFYVATTEVTRGQFRTFVHATAHKLDRADGCVGWEPKDDDRGNPDQSFVSAPKFTWEHPGFAQTDAHPVVGVSYRDATAYCAWLSEKEGAHYRLPTEAEWECACRAGTNTHFSFGNSYRDLFQRHVNWADTNLELQAPGLATMQWMFDPKLDAGDGYAFTAPVGSFQPNPWGLYDMHGNVWEWCADRYLDTYYRNFAQPGHGRIRPRAIDPTCDASWNEHGQWQVIRGGSWYVSPMQCRSASRGVFLADDAACYLGFRVVRDAPKEARQIAWEEHLKSEAALATLQALAKVSREYNDGSIRFEFVCDQLADEIFQALCELNYAVDVTIRPPGEIDSARLARLESVKRLTGFNLATGCTDVDAQTFSMLSSHTGLERLQITGSDALADEHLFPHLKNCQRLKEINLQGQGITDGGLMQLPELSTLETLNVMSTQCRGETLQHFRRSPLQQVMFRNLTDAGAEALAMFATLRHIQCPNSPISRTGLERLTSLRKIYSLNLENCQLLQDEDFALVHQLPMLQQLQVQGTQAGDQMIHALTESSTLRQLRMGSAQLTDQGLANLCQIVSLHELTITGDASEITEAGFADFYRLVNLKRIDITRGNRSKLSGSLTEVLQQQLDAVEVRVR